jgi:hypothetical protein
MLKKWFYDHWRAALTIGLVIVASAAMIALLAFFPPALPFVAGIVGWTLAGPAAIAAITAATAAVVAFVSGLFHGLSACLCKPGEPLSLFYTNSEGIHCETTVVPRKPRYKTGGVIGSSMVFATVCTLGIGFPLIVLGGWSVFVGVAGIYTLGLCASALFHAAFFGSVQVDNNFRMKSKLIEVTRPDSPPPPPPGIADVQSSYCSLMCGKIAKFMQRKPAAIAGSVEDDLPENTNDRVSEFKEHNDNNQLYQAKGRAIESDPEMGGWRRSEKSTLSKVCNFLRCNKGTEGDEAPVLEYRDPSMY